MHLEWSLRRAVLRTLIIALVSSALVGIYTFLFGEFGRTEIKILMTTLSISYFSVTSLACAAAFERRAGTWLAVAGLVVSSLGFLVFVPGIWAEFWDSEVFAKSMAILAIFAFSLAQVCLLSLVPLERGLRWVFYAAALVIFGLACLISGMIIVEEDDEWLIRIVGVLGILDGCGSLLIPVLYKLRGRPVVPAGENRFDHIELICPRCGQRDTYAIGTLKCTGCSLPIHVDILAKPATQSAEW